MMSTIHAQKSTTYKEAMCSRVRNPYCLDWKCSPKCHVTKGNAFSLSLLRGSGIFSRKNLVRERSLWTCSWRTMGPWPLLFLCLSLLATKIWPVLSSGFHTVMYFLDTNSKSIGLRSHGLKPLRLGTKSIFLFLKKDDYIRYFITVIKN